MHFFYGFQKKRVMITHFFSSIKKKKNNKPTVTALQEKSKDLIQIQRL